MGLLARRFLPRRDHRARAGGPAPRAPSGAAARAALALLFAAWALAQGPARAEQVQIESPAFSLDAKTNRYRYEGARVRLGGLIVEADSVEIDADTTSIVASGRVRFQDGSITGSAERLELRTATGTATLYNAEIYDAGADYFLSAEKLVRTGPSQYEGEGCTLTNCRPGAPGWHISASSIDYETDEHALAYNSILWLGPAPVLWTPLLGWPTVERRRSGVLAPSISQATSSKERYELGNGLTLPYFWAIGLDQDLTITPRHYSQRGTGVGLEYNYAFVEDQRGQWTGFGIDESEGRHLDEENFLAGTDLAREDNKPSRRWLRLQHSQGFGERTRLIGSSIQASDGQVLREYEGIREYRPRHEYQVSLSHQQNWLSSAATAAHTSEYVEESIFADSAGETDGATRPRLLPRVAFNSGWQPTRALALGFDLEGAVTRFVTSEGVSGRSAVARPAVSLPVPVAGSLEFRPTLGRRFVHYGELEVASEVFEQPRESRYDWLADAESLEREEAYGQNDLELELRLPLARRFERPEGNWQALKHRMVPRLIYRELEDVPQPLQGLLIVPEPALRLATLRLDHELLGQGRGSASPFGSSIARLNVIQRYDFLREDESYQPAGPPLPSPGETDAGEPLLPLLVEAGFSGSGFGISTLLRYHHQLARMVEYRLGLSGSVSERGSFGVSYSENQFTYRTPENRLYGAGSSLGFNGRVIGTDTISADFAGQVSLGAAPAPLNRRLQHAEVGLNYQPHCYGVRFSYVENVDVTREFDSQSGQNRDEFFIERRLLVTFTLGAVFSTTRQYTLTGF